MNILNQKMHPGERYCITKIFQRLEKVKRFVQDVKKERKQNEILLGSIVQRRVFPVLGVYHADDIIAEFKCIV